MGKGRFTVKIFRCCTRAGAALSLTTQTTAPPIVTYLRIFAPDPSTVPMYVPQACVRLLNENLQYPRQ